MTQKTKGSSSKAAARSTRNSPPETAKESSIHITIKPEDRFDVGANGAFRIGGENGELIFKLVNVQEAAGVKSYVQLERPMKGVTLIVDDRPPSPNAADWVRAYTSSGAADWVVHFAAGSGIVPPNRAMLFRGLQRIHDLDLALPNLVKMHGIAARRYGTKPRVVIALNDKPAARELANAKSKLIARGLDAQLIVGKKL